MSFFKPQFFGQRSDNNKTVSTDKMLTLFSIDQLIDAAVVKETSSNKNPVFFTTTDSGTTGVCDVTNVTMK